MLKYNKICFYAGIFVFVQLSLSAQNSTISPYTRFGYGVIADKSFGAGRSMGGIGFGLRSSQQINPMNPASYSSMDSLTFLFDVGATLQLSLLNDEVNNHKNLNGNLDYFAMQFPLSRTIAMSAGIVPYSHVGYNFYAVNETDDVSHMDNFFGSGGLNEVYVGLSMDIWKKRLSLGTNIGYMFGNVEHNSSVSYVGTGQQISTIYTMKKVNLHHLKYDLGVQYTHPLSKTERLTFGLAYSPKISFSSESFDMISADPYFQTNILKADTLRNKGFDTPDAVGFGVSYIKDNKLILAADFSLQNWSNAHFFDENNLFKNRYKVVVGGEYIPNNFTRSYLSRVRYRAGLNYSNSYMQINDSGYNEYGVCLGVGFPMLDNRSFINASLEYVRIEPENKSFVKEQYFRFSLSFTFNEYWFMKRRIE